MAEYIERERIEKFFDGIYDCADLTFEPNDHCCAADDCAHCKWRETMNAIQKRILSLPAADVRPVVHGKNIGKDYNEVDQFVCSECGVELQEWLRVERDEDTGEETYHEYCFNFCPNCGADMREAKT